MTPPLIVAGFHRSGTSAVARSLHLGGVYLGDDLLGAKPSNPHGHFEDVEVIHLHRDILDVNGHTWLVHQPFEPLIPDDSWKAIGAFARKREATGRPWGFKDPRVCLFLPLWLHVLPDAHIIVAFRSPAEAVRSLHTRHSRQAVTGEGSAEQHRSFWAIDDLGVKMWLHYHRELLKALPPDERVHVVDFGDRAAIEQLIPTLNRRWHLGLDETDYAALDPTLGRAPVDPLRIVDRALIPQVEEMWTELMARARASAER